MPWGEVVTISLQWWSLSTTSIGSLTKARGVSRTELSLKVNKTMMCLKKYSFSQSLTLSIVLKMWSTLKAMIMLKVRQRIRTQMELTSNLKYWTNRVPLSKPNKLRVYFMETLGQLNPMLEVPSKLLPWQCFKTQRLVSMLIVLKMLTLE